MIIKMIWDIIVEGGKWPHCIVLVWVPPLPMTVVGILEMIFFHTNIHSNLSTHFGQYKQ